MQLVALQPQARSKIKIARREDRTHGASKWKLHVDRADEQCTLGKRQDNGANHAPNCRIEVNKTRTKNKNPNVINDIIVKAYVILCGSGNRKKKHILNCDAFIIAASSKVC
jgi:hypothetical protein